MNNQSALKFEDFANLAHWITVRVHRRAIASGRAVDYEDIYQEVSMIWLRCRELYKPEFGVKFSTYFVNAGLKSFKRIMGNIAGATGESSYEDLSYGGEDGDGQHFLDYTPDPSAKDPEAEAIAREEQEILLTQTNPLLGRLVELSVQQPPELLAQLEAARAHQALAKTMGLPTGEAPPAALTPTVVGQILRFNWRKRKELKMNMEAAV